MLQKNSVANIKEITIEPQIPFAGALMGSLRPIIEIATIKIEASKLKTRLH